MPVRGYKGTTSNWDMNHNLSEDISHIRFPPRPFISVLWENTFVSVSQGSASLFSWCVFVLAAHTGCAHSFFAALTALLQFPANSNRERQKIKVWIVWAWFIKELWGLKIRVRSSQNVRKYREECWDFCFSTDFCSKFGNLEVWVKFVCLFRFKETVHYLNPWGQNVLESGEVGQQAVGLR